MPAAEGEQRIKVHGENTQSTGPVKYAENGTPSEPSEPPPPPVPPPPPEEEPDENAPAVPHRHKRSSKR
jgi:hypothetical protein